MYGLDFFCIFIVLLFVLLRLRFLVNSSKDGTFYLSLFRLNELLFWLYPASVLNWLLFPGNCQKLSNYIDFLCPLLFWIFDVVAQILLFSKNDIFVELR